MAATSTGPKGGRPTIMGTRGVVSAGHYLAAEAGLSILRRGGNAMDAGAAAGLALTVLAPHQNGLAGEVPMVVYSAEEKSVWAISGHGIAPRAATCEKYRQLGLEIIPGNGLLPAIVPAVVGSWLLLLRRFGTRRLSEVLAPVIELAEGGFPMYDSLHGTLAALADQFRRDWPSSAEAYVPGGQPPPIGSPWRQPDLARTLRRLSRADQRFKKREAGFQAAHDVFYRGPIARKIARFCRTTAVPDATGSSHTGFLTMDDFDDFEPRVEKPLATSYRQHRVFKCSTWTQGPVLLQTLNLLEGFDLAAMGHNSADYIHTVVECMKLAYADREFYYGDPEFVRVPLRRLLSKAYAEQRRKLVNRTHASLELRPGDRPALRGVTSILDVERAFGEKPNSSRRRHRGAGGRGLTGDTTSVQVADRAGNVVSAVPSGGWLSSSPVIPGLGFPLGTRGQMFCLVPNHPNSLEPGKRPRTSLTPSLAGDVRRPPHLAFASPGGDCQDQWTLQFFLNVVEFGLSLQEAVEAPTFWTGHFPGSFYPRTASPGSLHLEARLPKRCRDDLAARGHRIHVQAPWAGGNSMAAGIDRRTGGLSAAASPRYDPAYAMGW